MIVQELEEVVALLLFKADNVSSELRIHIQGLFPGSRVSSHYGVDGSAPGQSCIPIIESERSLIQGPTRTKQGYDGQCCLDS